MAINWGTTAGMAGSGAAVGAAAGPWGAVIGGVVGAAAGIVSGLLDSGDEAKIKSLQDQALAMYGDISMPSMTKIVAQQIKGTPLDPDYKSLKDAQSEGMRQLMEKSRLNGMDPQARAAYLEAQQAASGDYIGRQKAIEGQMASRGALGSGAEWAARAGSASDASQRLALASARAAGDSATRGQQALVAGTQVAGQGRTQDLQESAARDEINRFNAQMSMNADVQNNANAQNLFNDQLRLTDAKAGAMGVRQKGYERSEGRRDDTVQAGGQAVGSLAQLGMDYYARRNAGQPGSSGVPNNGAYGSSIVPYGDK